MGLSSALPGRRQGLAHTGFAHHPASYPSRSSRWQKIGEGLSMGEGRRANPWKGLLAGCYTDLSPNAPHGPRRPKLAARLFPIPMLLTAPSQRKRIRWTSTIKGTSTGSFLLVGLRSCVARPARSRCIRHRSSSWSSTPSGNYLKQSWPTTRAASPPGSRGADANARDRDGRTPLFEAVLWWKNPAIAELLFARGADVRARDKDGQTPLYAAAAFGDEAHLCVVLDHGAEIDARDAHGRTPLHYAAHLGRGEATTYLVSRGADVSLRDHDGRTPLDLLRTTIRLDPQQEYRWAPLERLLGGVVTMKVTEAGPQRGVADWGMLEALQDNDSKRVATWLARCRRQPSKRGRADAAIRGSIAVEEPGHRGTLLARGADVRRATRMARRRCTLPRSTGAKPASSFSLTTGRRLMPATRPAGRRCTAPPVSVDWRRRRPS